MMSTKLSLKNLEVEILLKKTAGTKSDGKKYNLKKHAAKTKRAEKKLTQII